MISSHLTSMLLVKITTFTIYWLRVWYLLYESPWMCSLLIRSSSPLIGYGSKKPPSKLDHYRFLSVAEVPIHLQSLLLGASKFWEVNAVIFCHFQAGSNSTWHRNQVRNPQSAFFLLHRDSLSLKPQHQTSRTGEKSRWKDLQIGAE